MLAAPSGSVARSMYDDDGAFIGRDYANGLISKAQLLELLEAPETREK